MESAQLPISSKVSLRGLRRGFGDPDEDEEKDVFIIMVVEEASHRRRLDSSGDMERPMACARSV